MRSMSASPLKPLPLQTEGLRLDGGGSGGGGHVLPLTKEVCPAIRQIAPPAVRIRGRFRRIAAMQHAYGVWHMACCDYREEPFHRRSRHVQSHADCRLPVDPAAVASHPRLRRIDRQATIGMTQDM